MVIPSLAGMYHPWRAFRNLAHVTLRWTHQLPAGIMDYTDHETSEVVMLNGLTQAERRCTIAHEMQHVVRGPVLPHMVEREEREVDKIAARLLLPDIQAVGEALAWAQRDIVEAAEELWVDVDTLRARLANLHPSERGYLKIRLSEPSS